MSIAADFTIDIDNKIVSHYSGSTVYTVNELYSYIQDYFDEILSMSITIPMSAQTPTEYTLTNGWFIPEETYKFLRNGAIKTSGWDTSISGEGILITKLSNLSYIPCNASDIGKVITDNNNTGILLDYNNSLRKWWIRIVSGTLAGGVTIVDGAGAGTITSVDSGESLYSNVYTLGSINTEISNILYVEQVNNELINNQITQYWSPGHIDIIVKVKEADTLIDAGNIRIYVREYTSLYSHFEINLANGGRNPVPLSTSPDSNNQTSSATVASWNDVTIIFGNITRDLSDGAGLQPYNVEIDCGSRASLSDIYERLKLVTSRNSGYNLNGYPGQFYRSTNNAYGEIIVSPFGTFSGGQFIGARGVYLKNVPSIDLNNYILLDANNVSHTAPYLAGISLFFSNNLSIDGEDASYSLFYKQINAAGISSKFGTDDGILVQKSNGVNIKGTLAGNISQVSADFDFDKNPQAAWTPTVLFTIGDFYRNGTNWYKVTTSYMSDSTFGSVDLLNSVEVPGPDVVLVSVALSTAQYTQTEGTITRSVLNAFTASSANEFNYYDPRI